MTDEVDESTIGRTPLVELDLGVDATVYGKVEWFNLGTLPLGGSVKSRIGKSMLDAAEAGGELDGRTVIEASSGNTGAALSRIGTARGHDVEIVLPDDAGRGKVEAIREAGAELHFVGHEQGYDAFVRECYERVAADSDRYYHPNQYENPANPGVHAGTTGPEIWRQTGGRVDRFVAGAGTGGTLAGVAHALGPRGVAVNGFEPTRDDHDIPGLKHIHASGAYVPGTFEPAVLDSMDLVDTETAYEHVRWLRRRYADRSVPVHHPGQWDREAVRGRLRVDGEFVVGPSSGACVAMVRRLADWGVVAGDEVVVIPLPDRGDRYPDRDL